jgi:peptidyl-tRNA hydrolase, PTH1 family
MVVGLGNLGSRYEGTRHNAGFAVVDRLASRWGIAVARTADRALIGDGRRGDEPVLLAKPQTFMNDSGDAVARLCRRRGVGPADLILIHDDVDVSPGRVKLRLGGGDGGNHGIESIIEALGTPEFLRVKVGVGRPPEGVDTADHVLAEVVDAGERRLLDAACDTAADAVDLVLEQGAVRAMNRINQREAVHGGSPL